MAVERQASTGLSLDNKQWGYSTGGSGAWALKFNGVYTAVVVGAPGFPARDVLWFYFRLHPYWMEFYGWI